MVMRGNDKTVDLYDTEAGKVKGYSPDGTKIAAYRENKEIMVWNRNDTVNRIIDGWRFHSLAVTKILFLVDNVELMTVSKDKSIRLW
jgi:WD40 repeat protein